MSSANKTLRKHQHVFQTLREEILSGQHAAGDRLPSESDLVERFGVSRPTVIRALRDLQHAGLVTRRVGSGTYACGAAEPTARENIAFLIESYPIGGVSVWGPISAYIAGESRLKHRSVLWINMPDIANWDSLAAERVCREVLNSGVSGAIFKPLTVPRGQRHANVRLAEQLADAGVAVVLLDFDVTEFPLRSRFDLVGIDNRCAGYLVTRHLLALGARRIHFLTTECYPVTAAERILGYQEALQQFGVAPQSDWIHETGPNSSFPTPLVATLASKPYPDAILCVHDLIAMRLIGALSERGVRVPEDIRVTGFDDVENASLFLPPLTTVRQPADEIGRVVVQTLLQRIAQPDLPPRDIRLNCELVVRRSCGSQIRPRKGKRASRRAR